MSDQYKLAKEIPLHAVEELNKVGRSMGRRISLLLTRLGYTGLALILAAVITVVMLLRFYGLPTPLRDYLLLELESRGVAASVDRLLLDPTGGIVAERVSIYRNFSRRDLWLQVDRVRIGIAWFSWWRGQPLLQNASVANANINLPLTDQSVVTLRQVNATVFFSPGQIEVRQAEARLLNLDLDLHGTITLNGSAPRVARTPEQTAQLDRLWAQVQTAAGEFDTERPLLLRGNFDFATAKPMGMKLQALLTAELFRWRGSLVDALTAEVEFEDQILRVPELRLKLARGAFILSGEANLLEKKGRAEFNSNLDFVSLAPAIGGRVGEAIRRLNFSELPTLNGKLLVDWAQPQPQINLQADLDWQRFSYGNTEFQRLTIPLAFDGNRLLIAEAELITRRGQVQVEALWNRAEPSIQARLKSSLDPTVLQGLFGVGADRFLQSLQFTNKGPELSVQVAGASNQPRDWKITGRAKAEAFSYKGVGLNLLQSSFTFTQMELDLPDLIATRPEGQATGSIHENFAEKWVRITNLQTSVKPQEVSTILGDKFVSYVAPYLFDKAPNLRVNGIVDLDDTKPKLTTNLTVEINGEKATLDYVLLGKKFRVVHPRGKLTVVDRDLEVSIDQAKLYDGEFAGKIQVNLRPGTPDFRTNLTIKQGDFKQMMQILFDQDKSLGKFNLNLELNGQMGQMETYLGKGTYEVENGYLMMIPFFSGLTFLLDNVIPGSALSKADRAKASFEIGQGAISTKDLNISSALFSVILNGQYYYLKDDVDMDARVNAKGLGGIIFFPVSKLFEYHGKGPLKDVKWGAKVFGG